MHDYPYYQHCVCGRARGCNEHSPVTAEQTGQLWSMAKWPASLGIFSRRWEQAGSSIPHPASAPSSPAHPRQPAASHRAKPPRCRDAGERKQNPTWRRWRRRRAGPGSRGRGGSRRAPGGWRWGPAVLAAPSCSAGLLRKKQRALATDFKIHEKCFVWLLLPWFCFKVVHCTEAAASSQLCWGCPQQGAVWWAQPCLRGGCDASGQEHETPAPTPGPLPTQPSRSFHGWAAEWGPSFKTHWRL